MKIFLGAFCLFSVLFTVEHIQHGTAFWAALGGFNFGWTAIALVQEVGA